MLDPLAELDIMHWIGFLALPSKTGALPFYSTDLSTAAVDTHTMGEQKNIKNSPYTPRLSKQKPQKQASKPRNVKCEIVDGDIKPTQYRRIKIC